MKTTKQKLVDTVGCGLGLWVIGFALGMMLFPFVPVARLGWIIVPVMAVVSVLLAFRRLRGSQESSTYFVIVGAVWLLIAVMLDDIFLVRAFLVQGYYDLDVFIYYALMLVVPIAVGLKYGQQRNIILPRS